MTAFATAPALAPRAFHGDKPGREIEYPTAIVILVGLAVATLPNLLVLPATYMGFGRILAPRSGSIARASHPNAARLVGRRREADDPVKRLTDREREVLALMAEGRSNKAIAGRLFVSEYTVEKHVGNIFTTLQLPVSPDDHRRVMAVVAFLNAK